MMVTLSCRVHATPTPDFVGDDFAIPAEPYAATFAQAIENANSEAASRFALRVHDPVGHDHETFHIAFSQERDSRIAQLMIPTIE